MSDAVPPTSPDPQARPVSRRTGLPLPDPFPDYVQCPHCGEPEVEVWCYQKRVCCHNCGHWIAHEPAVCRGTSAVCRPLAALEDEAAPPADG